jgi:hypothetical protein
MGTPIIMMALLSCSWLGKMRLSGQTKLVLQKDYYTWLLGHSCCPNRAQDWELMISCFFLQRRRPSSKFLKENCTRKIESYHIYTILLQYNSIVTYLHILSYTTAVLFHSYFLSQTFSFSSFSQSCVMFCVYTVEGGGRGSYFFLQLYFWKITCMLHNRP